jgi:5'-3' exonuclease
VALGLLLGSDYCPGGVSGVGKKLALQLVREWKRKKSTNLLDRFREWRSLQFEEGMLVPPKVPCMSSVAEEYLVRRCHLKN